MCADFLQSVVRPSVTVDIAVLTLEAGKLRVLVIERGLEPHKGKLALPGGFVHVGAGNVGGESIDDAAARELEEETGLAASRVWLQQVGAFGAPDRDPRGRVITVAYFALVRPELVPYVRAGSDAAAARFVDVDAALSSSLAFDHDAILRAILQRMRHDIDRTPLAFHLAPSVFSIAELRAVHEALHGQVLDAGNFRRRVEAMVEDGTLMVAPGKRITGKRPARVYQLRTPPVTSTTTH
jgi:8-oxo-dGTP diphosphatase